MRRRSEHILTRVVARGTAHRPAFESFLAGCVILGGSPRFSEPLSWIFRVGKGQRLLQEGMWGRQVRCGVTDPPDTLILDSRTAGRGGGGYISMV